MTVFETSTSSAPAWAATRAPMCTVIPTSWPSSTEHSPVWTPTRTRKPRRRTPALMAFAQRIARVGLSKAAKNPSPAVSISRPSCRASWARTTRWCRERSSHQRRSPSSTSRPVESTMSVNKTVAMTRSTTWGAWTVGRSSTTSISRISGRSSSSLVDTVMAVPPGRGRVVPVDCRRRSQPEVASWLSPGCRTAVVTWTGPLRLHRRLLQPSGNHRHAPCGYSIRR